MVNSSVDNSLTFDAVYYSQPVPTFETLTYMSFLFDRIYFPGVYIPYTGIDEKETIKLIERKIRNGIKSFDQKQLLNCMIFSLYNKYLKDICIFTGEFGHTGIFEDGTVDLTKEIDELIFGPPPKDFTPITSTGFAGGLVGDEKASVNSPGWLAYPANALLFAVKKGLPLINDNPSLPVPALGAINPKSNSKVLSTILAIESIKLVLPELKTMTPQEIAEFRDKTGNLFKPFRLSMLRLSKELNLAINSDMSIEEIQKEAKFIVETTVSLELEELKRSIKAPAKRWLRITLDSVIDAPELIANFASLPIEIASSLAIAKIIKKACLDIPELVRDNKPKDVYNTGLSYLLKIKRYQDKLK